MAKKLTRDLQEFEASLADLDYAPELLKRLLDLPENGLSVYIERFNAAMERVKAAEAAAMAAREDARRIAASVWRIAKANWSLKELKAATGYDHPD